MGHITDLASPVDQAAKLSHFRSSSRSPTELLAQGICWTRGPMPPSWNSSAPWRKGLVLDGGTMNTAGGRWSVEPDLPLSNHSMNEPLFSAIRDNDPEIAKAHGTAAATISSFRVLISQMPQSFAMAKLRFRDPDESERQGREVRLYLWLSEVVFHEAEGLYSGQFFEVPAGFEKWHAVGSRLAFDPEDVFDWMIIDDGTVHGGFTLRLKRQRLPESERAGFDAHVGAKRYTD